MASVEPALLWLAGICGAIMTIWGVVEKLTKPVRDLGKRVSALEDKAEANTDKLVHDHESFLKQEAINVALLRSQSALLKHCADGNHTGQLTTLAKELDEMIYEKGGKV